MVIWQVEFFPSSGERNSPYDYVMNLADENVRAKALNRLEQMQRYKIVDWPTSWINHLEGKIWEIYVSKHRLMYCLDDNTIVILHACKKVSKKTRRRDLKMARSHLKRYFDIKD